MNKKFEYKITPLLWALFALGLLAAGACIYLNVTRFLALLKAEDAGTYNYLGSLLSALIGVVAFVFLIPAIFASAYVITDTHLISKWGLVKNKYDVKEITRITHFRVSDKLVIFFKDESYTTINIDKAKFEEFIDSLKQANKDIFYQLNTEDKG